MATMKFWQFLELLQEVGKHRNEDEKIPESSPVYGLKHVGLALPAGTPLFEVATSFRKYCLDDKKDPMRVSLLSEMARDFFEEINHVLYLREEIYADWLAAEKAGDRITYSGHGGGD